MKSRRSTSREVGRLLALAAFAALAIFMTLVFDTTWLTSVLVVSGVIVAYHVPAVLLEWPLLQWGDIVGVFESVFDALGSSLSAVFDW